MKSGNLMVYMRILLAVMAIVPGFACNRKMDRQEYPVRSDVILDEHEKNKILQFYSAPEDSLKRKAAVFLLEHIPAHYSNEIPVLRKMEQEYKERKPGLEYTDSYKTFSLVLMSLLGDQTAIEPEKLYDWQFISGNYIIDNIEQAFKVWGNRNRPEDIDFETFCEYILPYKAMHEPLDYDRKYFQEKYTPVISEEKDIHLAFDNIIKACPVRYCKPMDKEFPYLIGVGLSHKAGVGNCAQQAVSEVMILRSAGIPASVDYVPQWGNYPGRHFITKLIDKKGKSTFDLSLSDFKFAIPKDSLPESIPHVQYIKTIPKVYRMAWSVQPDRMLLASEGRKDKTGLFENLYEKDVTEEYTECSTFSLQANDTVNKIVYLCVFGRDEWIPVCASPVNGGLAVFEKVGRGVVYLPALFTEGNAKESGSFQPVGDPFYFTDEGTPIALAPVRKGKQKAKLFSKCPVYSYTAAHAYRMKGGKFQGANTSGFSDAKTLFTIDYYPFYRQEIEIEIESNEQFRYFRYLPPPNVTYSLAELQFYTQDGDRHPELIQGTYFERYKSGTSNFTALKDNDPDTYLTGTPVRDSWIGYDAGENNECKLVKIVFTPQGDGNCIIPGYFYELCYWDKNKWNSLGVKRAGNNFLEYGNLPAKALFRLKCHTKGREERIFTMEDGVQVWW